MSGWCDRPGCAAPATMTFAFDGMRRILWLDRPGRPGGAVAGRLCTRHADRLSPPRGWRVEDRRSVDEDERRRSEKPVEAAEDADITEASPESVTPTPWDVQGTPGAELDDVLDARTPLLARAFRTAR